MIYLRLIQIKVFRIVGIESPNENSGKPERYYLYYTISWDIKKYIHKCSHLNICTVVVMLIYAYNNCRIIIQ